MHADEAHDLFDAGGDGEGALDVTGGRGRIVRRLSVQVRDVLQQRGPRRRRSDDQHGQRVASSLCFDERLAEMQQMASRLHFARPSQVGRVDAKAFERVPAGDDDVIGEDRAELEREHVERPGEFVRREQKRRREPGIVPLAQARRARAQIVGSHRIDDGQRVHGTDGSS